MNKPKNENNLSKNFYQSYCKDNMILRDYLALDRTKMAGERTILAYLRTALAFIGTGAVFIRFFESPIMHITGFLFLPSGIITIAYGLKTYLEMKKRLDEIK